MTSANTLCNNLLNVKGSVVEFHDFYTDRYNAKHLRIKVRPRRGKENNCPFCEKKLYDMIAPIIPAKYGVVTANVPWTLSK